MPKKVKLVLLDKLDENKDNGHSHSHRKDLGLPVGEPHGHSQGDSPEKRNSNMFGDPLN